MRAQHRLVTEHFGISLPMDPNNLLTQAAKWRAAYVSANTGGDMDAALDGITAAATLVR